MACGISFSLNYLLCPLAHPPLPLFPPINYVVKTCIYDDEGDDGPGWESDENDGDEKIQKKYIYVCMGCTECRQEDKDLSQGRSKMRNLQQLSAITVPSSP